MPGLKIPVYLTLREASGRFGVSVSTLSIWRRLGHLTRYERGDGRIVVASAELAQLIADRLIIVKQSDQGE